MAQNSIEIFDDTVIKLTVNQGTEEERSEISTGNFSMGELAFVRDTGRVFVGDSSDDITLPTTLEDGSLNYTKGGILVGNRYLGMIDSKPLVEIDTTEGGSNGTPLNYDTITPVKTEEGARLNERQLIKGNDAKFKKQMLIDSGDLVGRWDRRATYNKEYDAYNGDFVYDAYQNAIILFDKGITKDITKQKTILDEKGEPYVDEDGVQIFHDINETEISNLEDKISVKRRTPFVEYEAQGSGAYDNESLPKSNIYGDGYVIFRNIEPDNETLAFKQRSFQNDGKPSELNGPGYSHNVLTINKISTSNLGTGFFDTEQFNVTNEVSIKPELVWATEIGTDNDGKNLTIPERVNVKYGVDSEGNPIIDKFKMNQVSLADDEEAQILTLSKNQGDDAYNIKSRKPFEYKLNLGSGLITGEGEKTLLLKYNNEVTLELEDGISGVPLGVKDPYSLYDDDITWNYITEKELYYNDNLTLLNGFINDVDAYEKEYGDEAAEFISKYNSSGNVFTNTLKKPLALVWTNTSEITGASEYTSYNANLEFYCGPYIYCNKKEITNDSGQPVTGDEFESKVMVFGKNKKITNRNGGPLDLDTVLKGEEIKNAVRYLAGVSLNKLSKTEEESYPALPDTRDLIINSQEKEKELFAWYKFKNDHPKIGGEYTRDGRVVYIHDVYIKSGKNDRILIWTDSDSESKQEQVENFERIEEKTISQGGLEGTLYTIYSDCVDIIQKAYYKIEYTYSEEWGTESGGYETYELDYVNRKNFKFVKDLNLTDEQIRHT